MVKPFVSVVIPVLNDAARLKKCLEALENQTYPVEAYEVIVVDNGSSDGEREVVKRLAVSGERLADNREEPKPQTANRKPRLRYLHEPIRGLHQARNTGIKAAKGEVLAFTDADCLPAVDWLEKGVAALSGRPGIGLAGGRVDIFFRNPAKPTAAELFEKITAFRQKEYIEKMHFAAPANAFTLRSVIDKVGLFDGSLKSGADVDWGNRVFRAGYLQIYADEAAVAHPARRTLREIIRKHRRVIGGLYDIRKRKGYSLKKLFLDIKDDWPKPSDLISIFSDDRLKNKTERLNIASIMLFIRLVRMLELTRLFLGGKSKWG